MKCQTCGNDSEVIESRATSQGTTVRRRRQCPDGHRFTTIEVYAAMRPGYLTPDVIVLPATIGSQSRVAKNRKAKRMEPSDE